LGKSLKETTATNGRFDQPHLAAAQFTIFAKPGFDV
jgi:hypothetical protein